jgi:hypothetical protein
MADATTEFMNDQPAAQQAAAEPADLIEMEAKQLVARDAPPERPSRSAMKPSTETLIE